MSTASLHLDFESLVRRVSVKTILMVSVVMILALSVLSYLSLRTFETQLLPELERKAETVGEQVAGAVTRAVALGIPFRELVGMEALLDQVLSSQPEIQQLHVVDLQGQPVFYRQRAETPPPETFTLPEPAPTTTQHLRADYKLTTVMPLLNDENKQFGYLLVVPDPGYVREQQLEIIYDILTTLMISMLLTFEILFVMIALNLLDPLKQAVRMLTEGQQGNFFFRSQEGRSRDEIGSLIHNLNRLNQRIIEHYQLALKATCNDSRSLLAISNEPGLDNPNDTRQRLLDRTQHPTTLSAEGLSNLRLPLFVFFFGSELSRSFLPLFARSLYEPGIGITEDFAVALPFSIYLVFFMMATPVAGALSARIGPRRLFLLGLVPSLVGYGLTSFTGGLLELVAYRALNGIGYAMVSIAAIGYIVDISGTRSRAQGMAIFFNASMIAGVSGSAIGGILADRLGYELTFVISALLTVAAAALIWRLLPRPSHHTTASTGSSLRFSFLLTLLANARFVLLTVFCAMPTQIVLTGFFFYTIPLYLSQLGNSASVIGRIMMIYFLVVILVGPQVARYTDAHGLHRRAVHIGVLVAGIGMLLVGVIESNLSLSVAILCLALGNSMILSNQPSVLLAATPTECRNLGQTTVLGIFRLLERAGGALGPFVFAFLVARGGYQWATAIGGAMAFGCGVVFLLSSLNLSQTMQQPEESPI